MKAMEWNKYPEKKPERGGYYIVLNEKFNTTTYKALYYKDDDFFILESPFILQMIPIEITHWTTIPDFPI